MNSKNISVIPIAKDKARTSARFRVPIPILFMLPAVLLVVVVTFFPIIHAINLSFHETNFLQTGPFIGLKNYINVIKDPLFRQNLANSLIFTVCSLLMSLSLGLVVALLLNQKFPGRLIFRAALILPWVVSQILTSLIWRWMYHPIIGPLGYILSQLTNSYFDLLGNPSTALFGVILADVWRTWPYAMILLLAALQTVPEDLYDAAKIDGAGSFGIFRYVTFPIIQNTFLIVTIILSIHYFNMTEVPLVLTGGGPINRTDLIGLRVYREAFVLFRFGQGTALAVIMFIVNIIVSLLYIRTLRNKIS